MKNHPIYKDLNTSFVNLADLLKCLRQQRFVGKVHFKSGDYEANIFLPKSLRLKARENIKHNGKLTNKEVLRHVLLQARKPNGIINVYREAERPEPILKRLLPKLHKKFDSVKSEYSLSNAHLTSFLPRIHKQKNLTVKSSNGLKKIAASKRVEAFSGVPTTLNHLSRKKTQPNFDRPKKRIHQKFEKKSPPIPKPKHRILNDWDILLNLMGEILGTVDKHLAKANLNFAWMFEKVRLEVGTGNSFPNGSSTIFKYENGKIVINEKINSQILVENVLDVLQGVLKKLRSNSKFKEIYLTINQEILVLIYDRKTLYDKFSITSKIKEIAIN